VGDSPLIYLYSYILQGKKRAETGAHCIGEKRNGEREVRKKKEVCRPTPSAA